jgi:polyhydroxyalkanoate synthesis repressor PhaR
MIRLIKRYGSRKLYDTEESRYISLEDIAGWIREGQMVQVVDNKTSDDVTAQTLTQIISEEGRKGTSLLPDELLHDIIRASSEAVNSKVEHLQARMGQLVQASVDRLAPVRQAREEMTALRQRLEQLERSLDSYEQGAGRPGQRSGSPGAKRTEEGRGSPSSTELSSASAAGRQ